jgi:major membrane immunogen (membrane-anchored lipoprotein)
VSARPIARTAVFLALIALLGACGQSRSVTAYEPGVYKGAKDPLVDVQATPEHKALLKERFTKGQVDR